MTDNGDFEIVTKKQGDMAYNADNDRLVFAAIDNFPRILDIASEIVQIEKVRAQADAYAVVLREKRLCIEQEADAYVKKMKSDTDAVIGKAEVIRAMMRDYYNSGQSKLSGEEFSRIISDVMDRMWM